jgi:MFS family permease
LRRNNNDAAPYISGFGDFHCATRPSRYHLAAGAGTNAKFDDASYGRRRHMSIATAAMPAERASESEGWTRASLTVWIICILAWAFDIYEQTILQLITPILIKEWDITPAVIGNITGLSRMIGLVGGFVCPVLADLYGRKPVLIGIILFFSLVSGLTGFALDPVQMLIFASISRIALAGENPVGMVMVSETAPTKWRATALGGLVGGYPIGYMITTAIAAYVVPAWGWRPMYWIGLLPALLVFWIAFGIKESPRFEHVSTSMLKDGLKKQFNILAPFRQYPRETLLATLIQLFYLFTWIGWSSWMPQFLISEKKLGFQLAVQYLTIWMFVAIFAYYLCGWLCDLYGRRYVIPAFVLPASILLMILARLDDPAQLFWVGLATNFLITGSFGSGIGATTELFPTQIRGTGVGAAFTFGSLGAATAPAILGWIATKYTLAAGLPLLAFSFFLLVPLFLFFIPDMTRRNLTDFVGEKI